LLSLYNENEKGGKRIMTYKTLEESINDLINPRWTGKNYMVPPSEWEIEWNLPTKCVNESTFAGHPGYSHSQRIEHIEMLTSWEGYEFIPELFEVTHPLIYI